MECVGLVARPVFKTGLRPRRGRGGSIPPHSATRFCDGGSPVEFSHLDSEGAARMVNVGEKAVVRRTATASGYVRMAPETVAALRERALPKGDALNTARIAGVMAAKKTSELIPLCHGLALTSIDVEFEVGEDRVGISATARVSDRTGVEMEALTAVSVAALTIYDMCKAVDKDMEISAVRLVGKTKERAPG